MCCIMEENDKRLRRRGKVTIGQGESEEKKCDCDFNDPKFYDIIVFNESEYWSCRYGCIVTLNGEDYSDPTGDNWKDVAVDKKFPYKTDVMITYDSSNVKSSNDVNILIIKEQNLTHVWCNVVGIVYKPS